jgi:hypothetical protein
MKKLNKLYILAALTFISFSIHAFQSYAVEEKKKYKSTACKVAHSDGTTTSGTECYFEDKDGECASRTMCSN